MKKQFKENCHLKKPPNTLIHTYRPLIQSEDGKEMAELGKNKCAIHNPITTKCFILVGLVLIQMGFYPHILKGGYVTYRNIVVEYLKAHLEPFQKSLIVVTGPKTHGKDELTNILTNSGQQIINLESLSEIFSYSQEYFETILFNKFSSFDSENLVWIVYEPGEIGNMKIPQSFEKMMGISVRFHVEVELEMRIRFILQVSLVTNSKSMV